ncbi:MAG: hypothetical protein JWN17_486, partial [Frankiales bacterium]|nr:hypothetical protein [Frankiales bacterium]
GRAEAPADVAGAAVDRLSALPGVRACLVVRAPRPGTDPVVLASSGYDCTTMGPGAVLPRDAGLPVTECARTGEVQVLGTGPSWVAVPAGPGAALLLSLTCPPPGDDDLPRLTALGPVLEGALARAVAAEQARVRLLLLEEGLAAVAREDTDGLAVRSRPYAGRLSGDVVELVVDGPARWLLVADVCGRGDVAAVAADRLRAAFRACASGAAGPGEVLVRLDRVLAGGEEEFATALVVRSQGRAVRLASAGHPGPLLVPGGRLEVAPGRPVGLGVGPQDATETAVDVAPGALLLLATDGLTDRGAEVDLDAVVAALPSGLTAPALAGAVLAACEAHGPAQDDASVAVLSL